MVAVFRHSTFIGPPLPDDGRRGAFAACFVGLCSSLPTFFGSCKFFTDVIWMVPIMGFFQLAIFGGYAIYFPELFPTRLRSTEPRSVTMSVAIWLQAGPLTLGLLASKVFGSYGVGI